MIDTLCDGHESKKSLLNDGWRVAAASWHILLRVRSIACAAFGNADIGNTPSEMDMTLNDASITYTGTLANTSLCAEFAIGLGLHFTDM